MSHHVHEPFDILGEWPKDMQQTMHHLRTILDKNSALKEFKAAIDYALSLKVHELTEVKVHKPSDYVWFMNDLLTWPPTEKKDGKWIYVHLIVFYWVFNIKPFASNPEIQTQIVPQNAGKPMKPVTEWLVQYSEKMGDFMNTKASWPPGSLETFMDAKDYNIDWYQGPWSTFNDFFSRKLKVPRHIDGKDNDRIIVSPADCTYQSPLQPVDDKSDINVKGLLWNIDELLSVSDTCKKGTFAGGQFVHAFLKPYDYHRQHAPVAGIVREANVVRGQCYLQVEVDEAPKHGGAPRLRPIRPLPAPSDPLDDEHIDADDLTGYQFLQARGVVIIDNPHLGFVACLPIGMAQVSSVKMEPHIVPKKGQENVHVNKGDPISWFELGGSDFIMVFQKKACVELVVTPSETSHMYQGQKVIVAKYE